MPSSSNTKQSIKQRCRNPVVQFWILDIIFWFFIGIVSLLTLTLWYGEQNSFHIDIIHTVFQSFVGLIFSLPLFKIMMNIWNKPLYFRIIANIVLSLLVSLAWTVVRLGAYIQMTGFDNLWQEFGGWYFSSIFIYLWWTGLFYGIRYYQLFQDEHRIMLQAESEAREEQLKRLQAQAVARDTKIKMLRYQLNPHFLCNTLNAINALIEMNELKKAQKMTVQLSKFLRYSLDNNPDTKTSLTHELNALNLYLEIEKTRFGDRLQLDFVIDKKAENAHVPNLLLQPIIENSMKHVIAKNENGGTISIHAFVDQQWLVIEITDSGNDETSHIGKIKYSNNRGIGLQNIDERLKVLYGGQYVFDLNFMPSRALKTTIKIPYEAIVM